MMHKSLYRLGEVGLLVDTFPYLGRDKTDRAHIRQTNYVHNVRQVMPIAEGIRNL